MLRTQLIDELKLLRKRHRNDKYATFETRWIDVLDAVIGELEESRWHTGIPPIEDIDKDNQYCYALCFYYDGWWLSDYLFMANHEKGCFEASPRDREKVLELEFSDCVKWQKIEPYEASKERKK